MFNATEVQAYIGFKKIYFFGCVLLCKDFFIGFGHYTDADPKLNFYLEYEFVSIYVLKNDENNHR
jgi:hypothetical protein